MIERTGQMDFACVGMTMSALNVPPPSPGHRPFSFAAPRLSGVASPHAALKRRAISPIREAMKKLVAAFAALLMINTQAA
ncbi:hypothetical protein ABI013_15015, partial [Enterococcus faecium]|uniref:hypothetical protein n=1 Tax=Enterococcus faecium TaxID=1352 RepID=UPI003F42001B